MSQMRDNVRIRDNVESEEELLKLQEDFLANKPKAAATVIRKSKPPTVISSSSQLENNVNVVGETQKDIVILDDNLKTFSKSIKGETKSKKKKSIFSSKRQKSLESSGGAQRFEIDL